ncbi:MAG: Xaa-Pro peptidase family protein [Candidatus Sericytochromatia bacterium]|nr:Xaa-Pro peptidase family protein [Candidatus Sericytochromatia bacterium]
MDHAGRLARLRQYLADQKRSHLLVCHPANVAWLSGCSAEGACLLVGPERCRIFLDGRAARTWQGRLTARIELLASGPDGFGPLIGRCLDRTRGCLHFEPDGLDWWQAVALAQALPTGWSLEAAGGDVEVLRQRKDPDEIRILGDLARDAGRLRARAAEMLREGSPVSDVRAVILEGIARCEAWPAFRPLLATGLDTLDLHPAGPGRSTAGEGLALVDLGLSRAGLNSDVATSVLVAGRAARSHGTLLAIAEEAFRAAVAAVGPGVPAAEVAGAAHRVLRRHGLEARHDAGHGIGWQVHEAPWIAEESPDVIEEGMVLCLEPGAYHPAVGGGRREEMVLVTRGGAVVLGQVAADGRPLV